MNLTKDNSERHFEILPEGDYDFTVSDVKHKESKAGKPMWEVKLDVDNPNGSNVTIFDYLVEQDNMAWKFGDFFRSIGIYHEGMSTDEMTKAVGEIGWVKIIVQPPHDGWDESNKVKSYLSKTAKSAKKAELSDDDLKNLPF